MPRLNVRALAEMLHLPAYEQERILHDYKYPKQQPQAFRSPYYMHAMSGIRSYYRQNNDRSALAEARRAILTISQLTKRNNNERVISLFEKSNQFTRKLTIEVNPKVEYSLGEVQLRLSADIRAEEATKRKLLYYNCRTAQLDRELAITTIEIAHWILEQSGTPLPISSVEFIDLVNGKLYRVKNRRSNTIKRVLKTARIIETLWPTV